MKIWHAHKEGCNCEGCLKEAVNDNKIKRKTFADQKTMNISSYDDIIKILKSPSNTYSGGTIRLATRKMLLILIKRVDTLEMQLARHRALQSHDEECEPDESE